MILIIFFIAFAIYGIIKYLDVVKTAQVELFKNNLQRNIENMLTSTAGSSNSSNYYLPRNIKQVCFYNSQFENMYFVPTNYEGAMLEGVNIEKTLEGSADEKLCIETSRGKVYMIIKKDYNENEVTIAR